MNVKSVFVTVSCSVSWSLFCRNYGRTWQTVEWPPTSKPFCTSSAAIEVTSSISEFANEY